MEYRTIKINFNGDASTMLDDLPELLKKSKHFVLENYSLREAVEIAIAELYEALKSEEREAKK